MKFALINLMFPLLDAADAGSGGGATGAEGAAAGAGAGAGAGAAKDGAAVVGAAGSEGAARTGAASTGFTYKEDRGDWVPKHRFNEVNTRAGQVSVLEAQIAERDRKIAALAGVTPPDPNAARTAQTREAIEALYPQLGKLSKLSDEQLDRLLQAPDSIAEMSAFKQQQHSQFGQKQLANLYDEVADQIGADKLDDEQKADLQTGFSAWLKRKCEAEIAATGDSATLTRYESADPELLREFVKRHANAWIEPARRKVTQQAMTRVRQVPNSGGRAQVTGIQRPATFKSLDERLDYAANLAKERGVVFGS